MTPQYMRYVNQIPIELRRVVKLFNRDIYWAIVMLFSQDMEIGVIRSSERQLILLSTKLGTSVPRLRFCLEELTKVGLVSHYYHTFPNGPEYYGLSPFGNDFLNNLEKIFVPQRDE